MVVFAILSDLHIQNEDPVQNKVLDKIINHFESMYVKGKEINFIKAKKI
ncbi:MAG: hypothetical protein ACFE95_08315 [Candidatus Hodarchaeota archaeon]